MRCGRVFQDSLVYRTNRHVRNIYFAHECVASQREPVLSVENTFRLWHLIRAR